MPASPPTTITTTTKRAPWPRLPLPSSRAYHRAAVAYAVYGAVYLGGALSGLTPDRQTTYLGFVPWWVFYIVGVLLWIGVPWIVWRGHTLFTRIIAFGPAGKALVLFWQAGRHVAEGEAPSPYRMFFAATAVTAACLLAVAGWSSGKNPKGQHDSEQTGQ